jgi:hypothetical protein
MKLIANTINGEYLRDCLPGSTTDVDSVYAAIAYGQNSNDEANDFIGNCLSNKYRLDLWMRYDHTVPVAVPMLKRLLKHHKNNIFCKLIPDYLHAKVIWWRGYGAYIGSANLTDRAWITNIEAGVFFTESDLQEGHMAAELEQFFSGLKSIEQARPLTQELVEEMEALTFARKNASGIGRELRKLIPVWDGPSFDNKMKAGQKHRQNFHKEWQNTLTILRSIADQIVNYRPCWINEDIPAAWQADQFLHAYYYNQVSEGAKIPYEEAHLRNKANPQQALELGMQWWKATQSPPSDEDCTLYDWAPSLQLHLGRENIISLNEEALAIVCGHTHATRDHISKISLLTLGRHDIKTLGMDERVPLFASWLSKQYNAKGWTILELLNYVLYGGNDNEISDRLYTAARDEMYTLPHYGLNSMAELIGWVRPDVVPPRNGRTSKSLKALGYEVDVY